MHHTEIEIASLEIFIYHRKELHKIAEIKLTYFSSVSVSFLVHLVQADWRNWLISFLGVLWGPAVKAMDLFQ